jgi:hypothetical protein
LDAFPPRRVDRSFQVCSDVGDRNVAAFAESCDKLPDTGRAQLGWPLDRATFIRRLDELRVARNNVMHFNPEPLPSNTVEKLRNMLSLLRDFGGPLAS